MGNKPAARGKGQSQAMPNRTTAGFFVPFKQDLNPKESKHSRQKSFCFAATSRDAWASSHASKTNAPEVGKYKPKFSQVENKSWSQKIVAPQKNVGADRILKRDLQHSHWCDKILKNLNEIKHPGKRALRTTIDQDDLEDHSQSPPTDTINANGALNLNFGADGAES